MKKALLLPLSVLAIASAAGCSAPLDPAIINPSSESGQSSQLDPISIIERIEIKNLAELLADWHLGDAPRTIDLFTEPEVNILSYLQSGYLKVTVDDPSIIAINGLGVSALHEGTTVVRVSIGDKVVPIPSMITPSSGTIRYPREESHSGYQ